MWSVHGSRLVDGNWKGLEGREAVEGLVWRKEAPNKGVSPCPQGLTFVGLTL